jgi:hypothetical protein
MGGCRPNVRSLKEMKPGQQASAPLFPLVPYLGPGRMLVPLGVRTTSAPPERGNSVTNLAQQEALIQEIARTHNIRRISPRHMGDISMDLYMGGILSWAEYSMLAFQAELHPDFNQTIGALLGKRAEPDRRRDFVSEWEERLTFEKRYNAGKNERIKRATTIFRALHRIASSKNAYI